MNNVNARINLHPSLPSPPSHTHTYINSIPLLVHLQRQYNPSGHPVRSQGCTYNPTGLPVRSQGCTLRQTPNQTSLPNLSPSSRVLYILQETTRPSVYTRQVRGSILRTFLSPCGLPVSCCLATSVVRSRNPKRLVAPPRVCVCICMDSAGPAWSSLNQDLYGSERHESGICTYPSPGPWRTRRLDSTVWTLLFV